MVNKQSIIHIIKSDDITSVTEQIKSTEASSIRLVSDSGSSVLKSATNIKMIKRVADKNAKSIVVVNPHETILPILGQLKIRASKDSVSSPYLVKDQISDDQKHIVITSEETPQKPIVKKQEIVDEDGEDKEGEDDNKELVKTAVHETKKSEQDEMQKTDKGISIPNFEHFRTKALLVGLALLSLVALWFVAFKVMPSGVINIRLQTDKITVQETVSISNTFPNSDFAGNKLKAQKAIVEKNITKTVKATGVKNIGERAVGTISVKNQNSSTTENFQSGTKFESQNGLIFIADEAFSVGPASVSGGAVVPGSGTANVTAEKEGKEYNLGSGTNMTILNSSGSFTATIDNVSGGTTEEIEIISKADIDSFTQTLLQPADNEIDSELQRQFQQTYVVLKDTNAVEILKVDSDPAVGKEAKEAKVTATVSYSVFGVSKNDIKSLAEAKIKLAKEGGEKLYSVNTTDIVAKTSEKIDNGLIIALNIDSFIGPELDEVELAKTITGMRYSEVIDTLKAKPGVVNVEAKLSPFWVNKAPKPSKITFVIEVAEVSQGG